MYIFTRVKHFHTKRTIMSLFVNGSFTVLHTKKRTIWETKSSFSSVSFPGAVTKKAAQHNYIIAVWFDTHNLHPSLVSQPIQSFNPTWPKWLISLAWAQFHFNNYWRSIIYLVFLLAKVRPRSINICLPMHWTNSCKFSLLVNASTKPNFISRIYES